MFGPARTAKIETPLFSLVSQQAGRTHVSLAHVSAGIFCLASAHPQVRDAFRLRVGVKFLGLLLAGNSPKSLKERTQNFKLAGHH